MKEATQGYRGGIDVVPTVGTFCCAKFTDETWYRAKVVDIVRQGACMNICFLFFALIVQ